MDVWAHIHTCVSASDMRATHNEAFWAVCCSLLWWKERHSAEFFILSLALFLPFSINVCRMRLNRLNLTTMCLALLSTTQMIVLVFLRVLMLTCSHLPKLAHFPRQPHSTAPPPEPVLPCETASPYPSLHISVQQTPLWLPPLVEMSQCEHRLTLHTISVSATEQVKIKVFWAWLGTKSRTRSKVEAFSHSRHRCTTCQWTQKLHFSQRLYL